MSALSYCVTCGIVVHAALRCSAVLRRMSRIGLRSIVAPLARSRAAARPATPRGRSGRRRVMQPLARAPSRRRSRCGRRARCRHLVDVDAELAREAAHRRRGRRRRRRAGRAGAGGRRGRARARLMSTTLRHVATSLPARRGRSAFGALRRRRWLGRRPARRAAGAAAAAAAAFALAAPARRRRRSSTVRIDLADLDLVARLDLDVLDDAGDRRRHLDRRLVGLELEDRLILGDRVAGLHQHAERRRRRRRSRPVREA